MQSSLVVSNFLFNTRNILFAQISQKNRDCQFKMRSGTYNLLKIFETDSSFQVKWRTMEKVQYLFFRRSLLVLAKFLFREED